MRRSIALLIAAVAALALVPAFAAGAAPEACSTPAGTTLFNHTGASQEFSPVLTPAPAGPDAPTGEVQPVFDVMNEGSTQVFSYQLDLSGAPLLPTGLPATAADVRVKTEWTDPTPAPVSDYDMYVKDANGNTLIDSHTFNPQTGISAEEGQTRLPHCAIITIEFVSASGVPGVDAKLTLTPTRLR